MLARLEQQAGVSMPQVMEAYFRQFRIAPDKRGKVRRKCVWSYEGAIWSGQHQPHIVVGLSQQHSAFCLQDLVTPQLLDGNWRQCDGSGTASGLGFSQFQA